MGVREDGRARPRAPGLPGPREESVPVGREPALSPGLVECLLDMARDHCVGAVPGAQEPRGPRHLLQVPRCWSNVARGPGWHL
eukprot:9163696-Alexandrium_andersonii.AAC.1